MNNMGTAGGRDVCPLSVPGAYVAAAPTDCMQTVTHHGRETAYSLARPDASGPTALFVHGSGGTHRVWAPLYGPAGPTHPAAALDLSGHGASEDIDTDPGPETLGAYVADVVAVAAAIEADVLVGNSLGGAIVQQILLKDRTDVSGAVLAGTGAKLAVTAELRTWLAEDFGHAIDALHSTDLLFHDPDETVEERSRETMREVGRAVTERDFLTCHTFDIRTRVGELDLPLLALVGEHDRLTPPSYHEYYVEQAPEATLSVLGGAAHLAMVERPTAFADAVASFLDDCGVG